MTPRHLADLVGESLLNLSDHLDDAAIDLQLVRGSTLTVRILRLAANLLIISSMPIVLVGALCSNKSGIVASN